MEVSKMPLENDEAVEKNKEVRNSEQASPKNALQAVMEHPN
jgi:hypothetical protein